MAKKRSGDPLSKLNMVTDEYEKASKLKPTLEDSDDTTAGSYMGNAILESKMDKGADLDSPKIKSSNFSDDLDRDKVPAKHLNQIKKNRAYRKLVKEE